MIRRFMAMQFMAMTGTVSVATYQQRWRYVPLFLLNDFLVSFLDPPR